MYECLPVQKGATSMLPVLYILHLIVRSIYLNSPRRIYEYEWPIQKGATSMLPVLYILRYLIVRCIYMSTSIKTILCECSLSSLYCTLVAIPGVPGTWLSDAYTLNQW